MFPKINNLNFFQKSQATATKYMQTVPVFLSLILLPLIFHTFQPPPSVISQPPKFLGIFDEFGNMMWNLRGKEALYLITSLLE